MIKRINCFLKSYLNYYFIQGILWHDFKIEFFFHQENYRMKPYLILRTKLFNYQLFGHYSNARHWIVCTFTYFILLIKVEILIVTVLSIHLATPHNNNKLWLVCKWLLIWSPVSSHYSGRHQDNVYYNEEVIWSN